jgi:hypothetical protein
METDETTVSRSARVRDRLKQAAAFVLGLLFLPLWAAVGTVLSDEPLWTARTVETTQHYGIIPDGAPILAVAVLAAGLTYAVATGEGM